MNEIWKPCPGYEGLYEVSNLGRVQGVDRYVRGSQGTTRFIAKQLVAINANKKRRYPAVALNKQGRQVNKSVHRLVAIAFHPNPHNLPEVNHKDGIKENSAASNLEWSSRIDNIHHAQAIGLTPTKKPKAKKDKPAALRGLLSKALELHNKGFTRKAIAQQLGFSVQTIAKHLKEKPPNLSRYTVRHEVTSELIQKMKDLRLEGKKYREIAEAIVMKHAWVYRQLNAKA